MKKSARIVSKLSKFSEVEGRPTVPVIYGHVSSQSAKQTQR